jgi:hypothetical protein
VAPGPAESQTGSSAAEQPKSQFTTPSSPTIPAPQFEPPIASAQVEEQKWIQRDLTTSASMGPELAIQDPTSPVVEEMGFRCTGHALVIYIIPRHVGPSTENATIQVGSDQSVILDGKHGSAVVALHVYKQIVAVLRSSPSFGATVRVGIGAEFSEFHLHTLPPNHAKWIGSCFARGSRQPESAVPRNITPGLIPSAREDVDLNGLY